MADEEGRQIYALRNGDAYRDPRAFGTMGKSGPYGAASSMHKLRLARDLILDKLGDDGEFDYQTKTSAYRKLGELWESMDPANRWGGRYNDGNHFERLRDGWDNRTEPLS